MSFLSSLLSIPVDWVLPSRCPLCGVVVAEDHQFCLPCWQKLDFVSEPWCVSCGVPFAFEHVADAVCGNCLVSPPHHDGVRAAVVYDDNSGRIAMGLKYSAKLGFAELIAKHLQKFMHEFEDDSLLVPVPLHRKRLWVRGFNQSVLIANALAARSGLVQKTTILTRKIATPPLRLMTAKQRQKLVNRAISLGKNIDDQIDGRTVLLVDDVYTTGATTNSCARLLKSAGVKKVVVLCWARVVTERERA